jgi:hypothetical protein
MAIKIPKTPHHSGKNAETGGVGHGKGKRVAGSKKNIAAKRKVAPGKTSIKKA